MDSLYIWHDGRPWSKELLSAIPTPGRDLGVKVMDLEFSEKNVILMIIIYICCRNVIPGMLVPYDSMIDLEIYLGHCDLYFMVQ